MAGAPFQILILSLYVENVHVWRITLCYFVASYDVTLHFVRMYLRTVMIWRISTVRRSHFGLGIRYI